MNSNEVAAMFGVFGYIAFIVLCIMLFIAPLMIWHHVKMHRRESAAFARRMIELLEARGAPPAPDAEPVRTGGGLRFVQKLFEFDCPHCAAPLKVERNRAGEVVPCPSCQKNLRIPHA